MKSSIVVLLVLLLSGCIYVNVPLQQGPAPAEEKVVEGRGPAKIAVLDLSGRFTSTSSLPARLSPGPSILPKFK
ncbi:MAG TPA: hypothetical protein VJ882_00115, partial [Desulfuromonadales bacterium]|nr:hypothetical protein [Desulfuromonadales bacterium]